MKLQFLGTGAGLPAKFRNTQSFVFNFMQELKECWMFDCGEATQHQILRTNIKPTKITKIFIIYHNYSSLIVSNKLTSGIVLKRLFSAKFFKPLSFLFTNIFSGYTTSVMYLSLCKKINE